MCALRREREQKWRGLQTCSASTWPYGLSDELKLLAICAANSSAAIFLTYSDIVDPSMGGKSQQAPDATRSSVSSAFPTRVGLQRGSRERGDHVPGPLFSVRLHRFLRTPSPPRGLCPSQLLFPLATSSAEQNVCSDPLRE